MKNSVQSDIARQVLHRAVGLVEPSPDEEVTIGEVARLLVVKVEKVVQELGIHAEVVIGGSYAKGTWLRGDADVDVFVRLSPSVSRADLERLGREVGLAALRGHKPVLRYSDHPYVEGTIRNVRVNIVVCYNVKKGEWVSAADRSPYHTIYVKKEFNEDLRRETRLLKKFLKTVGIYGAEVRQQGFSGYVCEVLTLRYGGFEQTLRNIYQIKEGEVISVEPYEPKTKKEFESPIIILDPVDPRRNLGAAISPESVAKFILSARRFLRKPSLSFFQQTEAKATIGGAKNHPMAGNLAAILFKHKEKPADDLWGQLKRSLNHLGKQVTRRGFRILRSDTASNEKDASAFIFLVESVDLPQFEVRMGPPVAMGKNCDEFLKKRRRNTFLTWVGPDMRIYAVLPRRTPGLKELLGELTSGGGLTGSGIAPGLKSNLEKSRRILIGRKVLTEAAKHSWLEDTVANLLASDPYAFG